ncbi:MAG TPA: hypothetical protein VF534_20065 [Paraburkholderia sp.]
MYFIAILLLDIDVARTLAVWMGWRISKPQLEQRQRIPIAFVPSYAPLRSGQ